MIYVVIWNKKNNYLLMMSKYLLDYYQKNITLMDCHNVKLSKNEDLILKKSKVLHIGFKNIKVEYKLRNREIKNVNEK